MAYRFNPPPNWPIQEKDWTPPPGWQPDPTWGPAPENWDFWVDDTAATSEAGGADDAAASSDAAQGVDGDHDGGHETQEPAADAHSGDAQPAQDSSPYEQETISPVATDSSYAYNDSVDQNVSDAYGAAPTETISTYGDTQPLQSGATAHSSPYGGAQASGYGSASEYGSASASPYSSQAGYGSPQPASSDPYASYGTPVSADPNYGTQAPSWQGGDAEEPPHKSFLAKFWWIGCIIFLLIGVLIAVVGFIAYSLMGGSSNGTDPAPTAAPTTQTPAAPTSPAPTTPAPTSPAPTTAAPTTAAPTSAAPTASPSSDTVPPVTTNLKKFSTLKGRNEGTVAAVGTRMSADEVKAIGARFIDPPKNSDKYIVVRVTITDTKGTVYANPINFSVQGDGSIEKPVTATYGIPANRTQGIGALENGASKTMVLVFDAKAGGGQKLVFSPAGLDAPVAWDITE